MLEQYFCLVLEAPVNLNVIALSSTALSVSWEVGVSSFYYFISTYLCIYTFQPPSPLSTTAEPLFWTAQISEAPSGLNVNSHTTDFANITSAVFTGLEKGTNYQVKVAGINVRGYGAFTNYQQIETLIDRKLIV